MRNLLSKPSGRAAATFAYVAAVGIAMSNASKVFGEKDTAFTPVFVLLLFVISAAVTGYLVAGKPIMLYIDGAKKEAVAFLGETIAWLAGFLVLVGILMAATR
jgi:hypothetical protein